MKTIILEKPTLDIGSTGVQVPVNHNLNLNSKIIYTEEQVAAIDKIISGIKQNIKQIRLVGSAGVGKTTILREIVNQIEIIGLPITIICPTHKAVKVAKAAINKDKDEEDLFANFYEPITLAKALGKVPTIKIEDGRKIFVQQDNNAEPIGGIIIVDEASMLSNYDLERLLERVDSTATILYVLDPIQLPPINHDTEHPPVYELDIESATLTQTQRFYSDSTIGTITTRIRKKDPTLSGFNWNGLTSYCHDKPDVQIYSNEELFMEDLVNDMELYDWSDNPESVRCLSWTNSQVDKYNDFVKQFYFNNDTASFVPNEVLIAKAPFVRTNPDCAPSDIFSSASPDLMHYINNGEEFKLITKLETNTFTHPNYTEKPITYDVWSAQRENGESFTTNIVNYKGRRNYNHVVSQLNKLAREIPDAERKKKKKAWAAKYKFMSCFDNCKRAYALTVHSSQGSTFTNIYFDLSLLNSPMSTRIRRALLYTAMTRPTTSMKLYIPPQYISNSLALTIR